MDENRHEYLCWNEEAKLVLESAGGPGDYVIAGAKLNWYIASFRLPDKGSPWKYNKYNLGMRSSWDHPSYDMRLKQSNRIVLQVHPKLTLADSLLAFVRIYVKIPVKHSGQT